VKLAKLPGTRSLLGPVHGPILAQVRAGPLAVSAIRLLPVGREVPAVASPLRDQKRALRECGLKLAGFDRLTIHQ
jgi:hypothetical protein